MAPKLTTYVASRSSDCQGGGPRNRRVCGWWRACRYLLSGGSYGHNQLYYGCAHRPVLQSGRMEWRAGRSRRLRNSFVRLLDRELCPFQVRGGGVERLSSSSIATAMAPKLTTYIASRSSDCQGGGPRDRRVCGWWRACRYL